MTLTPGHSRQWIGVLGLVQASNPFGRLVHPGNELGEGIAE